jgi:pectate lyase
MSTGLFAATALILAVTAATAPTARAEAVDGVWSERPVGFAAVAGPDGHATTGGAGGAVVRATTLAQLRSYASAPEPLVVRIAGSITVDPFGDMVQVSSDKTLIGAGPDAELLGGGLFLNGSHNVIIRNLTIRDSYVPGDWDGKSADNDNDGIRLDTADHVWIDHTRIERVGDGGIDIRKDSDFITLSWNVVGDINKALGVGWTGNVVTKLTAHHNWIRNTVQRNWSLDNTAAAHLYNNYLSDIAQYGTMSRNNARVVVEDSVFERVNDPLVTLGGAARLVQRRNIFTATSGRIDAAGDAFDPATYYPYTHDRAARAVELIKKYAGPQRPHRPARPPRTVTVAPDGDGTYGSLLAALGATRDADGPVTVIVRPGVYRELVRVWPDQPGVTITGSTGEPGDVVISYDLAAAGQKFYGGSYGSAGAATFTVLGNGTTVRDLTIANTYGETVAASAAPAVRSVGDRTTFDGTRFVGEDGTFQSDTGDSAAVGRSYLRGCYIEGDTDFIAGSGTAVFDRCTVFSSSRGDTADNGGITAAGTDAGNPHGFLFIRCAFRSDAPAKTVHLGRPARPASDPRAVGQVVVRESLLGAQIADAPWIDAEDFPWRQARFAEYANTGPGATVNPDRPQLSAARAAEFTREAYLRQWQPRS